ncbi:MAG: NADH-quinone oxidoreductase subunit C [Ignavibacteriaceae bacterium]
MKNINEIFTVLKDKFPEAVLNLSNTQPVDPFIEISPLEADKICLFLRDNDEYQFDSLIVLSGTDDANGETKNNPEGGITITGGTLSVYYHLESISLKHKVVLKTSAPREKAEVASVAEIWKSADWHEREVYDLIGIVFLNHPDLRRILMPYDWEAGHPLRKDYKNPEFYQGMRVPY